jgi:hypothetical protein
MAVPKAQRPGKPTTPPDARAAPSSPRPTARPQDPGVHEDRWLWLVAGRDTLLSAQVAIGMRSGFEFEGRRFWFETPRSERRVLAKEPNPFWTPPEWHYMERAKATGPPW